VYADSLRRYLLLATLPVLVLVNAGLGVMMADARAKGIALAVIPLVLVVIGSLVASNRAILVYAAIAIGLFKPLPLADPLPLHIGVKIYPSDLLVLLAVASWITAWLLNPEEERPSSLRTRLLGLPLLLFGIVLFAGIVRGHDRYGQQIFGVPSRFVLYAGIAAALTDIKPRAAYKWLTILFYTGTLWQAGVATYRDATGNPSAALSQTLSTGGERVLGGSIAMLMAGALLLALLNLERDRRAGTTALHLLIAVLATFALVSTYQRTTFALISILVPIALLAFRRLPLRVGVVVPLLAPFLVLGVLFIATAVPNFFPTFADRVTATSSTDTSAHWRQKAISSVWDQVQESPLTGVGFGRDASFGIGNVRVNVGQDPHDQFIFLWAGGGLLLLASFVLLLVVFLLESWSRFRRARGDERRLIFWAVSMWFVLVVNSLTGVVLTEPHLLLIFWIVMLLPMTVRPERSGSSALV
jgi:O-antigen ligase